MSRLFPMFLKLEGRRCLVVGAGKVGGPKIGGLIDTGAGSGINGHVAALGHEPHQFTHFYIETDDVAALLKTVEIEGGKTIVPPVEIPSGTFAWFADVEGNIAGLWKPNSGA